LGGIYELLGGFGEYFRVWGAYLRFLEDIGEYFRVNFNA